MLHLQITSDTHEYGMNHITFALICLLNNYNIKHLVDFNTDAKKKYNLCLDSFFIYLVSWGWVKESYSLKKWSLVVWQWILLCLCQMSAELTDWGWDVCADIADVLLMGSINVLGSFYHPLQNLPVLDCAQTMAACDVSSQDAVHQPL